MVYSSTNGLVEIRSPLLLWQPMGIMHVHDCPCSYFSMAYVVRGKQGGCRNLRRRCSLLISLSLINPSWSPARRRDKSAEAQQFI